MLSCSADHVAAFTLLARRPSTAPGSSATLLFAPDEVARGRLRPVRRRSTSGTWSTGRTGRSASRCSAACRRAPTRTAGSRRWRTTAWTSGAGCCRGSGGRYDDLSTYDVVVVGLGRARQRRGLAAGPPRRIRRRARAVRARAPARRLATTPRRILRHSYHTPGLRRLTSEAYDDWARPRGASRRAAGHGRPAASTCSRPDAAIPADDYTASRWRACGVAVRAARRAPRSPRAGRSCALPDGHRRAAPGRHGDRARPAAATAAMQRLARRHGAELRERAPVTARASTAATARRRGRRRPATTYRCAGRGGAAADAWTNDVLGHLGAHAAARR